MSRCDRLLCLLAIALATSVANSASAALILYEPFDYQVSDFLSATTIGAANSTTSPRGYLAPNNNHWFGTGINAGGYQSANDGQVTSADLTVPGLYKPNSTRSLTVGGTGHTMRLSLNTSVGPSNQTGPNATDTPDPRAGTNGTLQASDTAGTGYYSMAVRVDNITGLNATGGVLAGFNNIINAQTGNPTTAGAALTIRPKAGGGAGEFELGVVKQGTSNFANAEWDLVNTYTTGSTIFVVGKYQTVGAQGNFVPAETNDIASLWINPDPSTFGGGHFEPTGALTNTNGNDIPTNASTNSHTLQSFILRQNGTAVNNQIPVSVTYDELRVGTSWMDVTPIPEPNTLTLVALLGAMLIGCRRRS